MPIDPSDFRAVLGRYATGVTIVTTRDADLDDVLVQLTGAG